MQVPDAATQSGIQESVSVSHNFENGNQNGWTCGGITTCGSLSKICGGYGKRGKGQSISRTFNVLPDSAYIVEMDILAIDSWDSGEYAYLTLNGERVWEGGVRNAHGKVVLKPVGNKCGASPGEQCHHDP